MHRPEITGEQVFQEAYLAEQYTASGDPEFAARADRIRASHEGIGATTPAAAEEAVAATEPKERFGLIPDEDPRVVQGKADRRAIAYERRFGPVELRPRVEVNPANPER